MPTRPRLDSQILIVDDSRMNVALLELILRRAGYSRVSSTTDPRETFELCRRLRPDVILLDLTMPHMDGYEVLTRLEAEQADPAYLPILVLTADATPEAKRTALSLGAMDFLTKPFDATEVLLRVANLLETRGVHLELERRNVELERRLRVESPPPPTETTTSHWSEAMGDRRLSRTAGVRRLSIPGDIPGDEAPELLGWLSEYCTVLAGAVVGDGRRRELIGIAGRLRDMARVAA